MEITVRLHDILKDRVISQYPEARGSFILELPEEAKVRDLACSLGLSDQHIGLIVINGSQAKLGESLNRGDRVELFSPMSGG